MDATDVCSEYIFPAGMRIEQLFTFVVTLKHSKCIFYLFVLLVQRYLNGYDGYLKCIPHTTLYVHSKCYGLISQIYLRSYRMEIRIFRRFQSLL